MNWPPTILYPQKTLFLVRCKYNQANPTSNQDNTKGVKRYFKVPLLKHICNRELVQPPEAGIFYRFVNRRYILKDKGAPKHGLVPPYFFYSLSIKSDGSLLIINITNLQKKRTSQDIKDKTTLFKRTINFLLSGSVWPINGYSNYPLLGLRSRGGIRIRYDKIKISCSSTTLLSIR